MVSWALTLVIFASLKCAICAPERYMWSFCNDQYMGGMNCRNGLAYDETITYVNASHVSVHGLGLVFQSGVRGDDEEHGLVEFVFGDKFGVYEDLVHVKYNQTYIKVLGKPYDVTAPSLNIALEKELVTDGIQRWYDTRGSRDDCSIHFAAKSFALLGHEPWELISRDGSSVCIRLEDTTTYIPGIVRDVALLGFDYEPYNICALILGCTPEGRKNITLIPNFETHGVLIR